MAVSERTGHADAGREPLVLRVIDRISAVAAVGAGVALAALVVNVTLDVVVRTVTDRPLGLTLELTTFWWMPLLVTLSYAITEREREHITVMLLLDRLPRGMRRYVEAAFTAIATALVTVLAYYTTVDAFSAVDVRLAANSTPPLPYWQVKLLVALGLSLLALQFAATTYRHITGRSRTEDQLVTEADAL